MAETTDGGEDGQSGLDSRLDADGPGNQTVGTGQAGEAGRARQQRTLLPSRKILRRHDTAFCASPPGRRPPGPQGYLEAIQDEMACMCACVQAPVCMHTCMYVVGRYQPGRDGEHPGRLGRRAREGRFAEHGTPRAAVDRVWKSSRFALPIARTPGMVLEGVPTQRSAGGIWIRWRRTDRRKRGLPYVVLAGKGGPGTRSTISERTITGNL